MEILVQIDKDKVISAACCGVVSGNVESYEIIFDFSSEWENLIKFAVFKKGGLWLNAIVKDNSVKIPFEVMSVPGVLYVGAFGVDKGDEVTYRIVTDLKGIKVLEGAYSKSLVEPLTPTPDVWEEYIKEVQGCLEAAQAFSERAEAAAEKFSEENITKIIDNGVLEAKESGVFDGVSCSHSWNGTVLSVTSASGTSEADLKGDKGERGENGADGKDGTTLTKEQLRSIDIIPQIEAASAANTNNLEQEVLARKAGESALTAMASEALSVAKGANQALSYDSYEDMYNSFVLLCSTVDGKNKYPVGNNVFIKTLNVPDLWISAIRDDTAFDCITPEGSFCGDDSFVSLLKNEGKCQIGYYVFSALETQKVDLSEYATIAYVDNALGSIETALDNIIAVQNELIGGESV